MALFELCLLPKVLISIILDDVQYILKSADISPITSLSLNKNATKIKNALLATHSDGTL